MLDTALAHLVHGARAATQEWQFLRSFALSPHFGRQGWMQHIGQQGRVMHKTLLQDISPRGANLRER